MKALQQTKYQDEIERCSRLYQGFKDAALFVSEIFNTINKHFEKHPVEPLPAVNGDDAADLMRKDQSLRDNPKLKTADVVGLMHRMGRVVVKTNFAFKDKVKEYEEQLNTFFADHPDEVSKEEVFHLKEMMIKETVLEKDLAAFLFSFMLSSFYRQKLQPTAEVLRTDLYEGGECPLCGEKPHFGMLRPPDGAKQLECWLCGTQWVHTRIKCPFCNNQDQEELGYFTVEGNEVCRVNYCQLCCSYYKIFDARKFNADGSEVLAIHNLATLSYDLLARQEGFLPGSVLEWVNDRELAERKD